MIKILIVGSSGLLGINMAIQLRDSAQIFFGTHSRKIMISRTYQINLDLTDQAKSRSQIKFLNPDVVINCAGYTNVESCENNPEIANELNVVAPVFLAKLANEIGFKYVHISTDHMWDGTKQFVTEEEEYSPLNVYGRTKAIAESAILKTNPYAIILRTNFFCWGPKYRKSFSDIIIKSLKDNNQIELFEDVFFTPIYSGFLVDIMIQLLRNGDSGMYNVVCDERVSKYEFGLRIAEIFGLEKKLIIPTKFANIKLLNNLAQRPLDMSLSNSKSKDATDLKTFGCVTHHIELLKKMESFEHLSTLGSL